MWTARPHGKPVWMAVAARPLGKAVWTVLAAVHTAVLRRVAIFAERSILNKDLALPHVTRLVLLLQHRVAARMSPRMRVDFSLTNRHH